MNHYKDLKDKKLFLMDMDGTIYIDDVLFEHSLLFLDLIRAQGGKYVFLTNNSSKSVNDYISKLSRLGIDVDASNFLTSSQATALYLQENYQNKNLCARHAVAKKEFQDSKLWITDQYEKSIDCLVVGYDTELNYGKLIDACRLLIKDDVDFIATNPDYVCPVSFGYVPDCGSICEMLTVATKKQPRYIGKPNAAMVELAIKNSRFIKEETIVIGDRLYTDIACANNAKVTSALVLSGETKQEDVPQSSYKADYIFKDIGEIYKLFL